MIPYNKNLVSNARELRKNMTPEEKHLWYDFLKRIPLNVRRQHNIENYIVDFYIAKKRLLLRLMDCSTHHLSTRHRISSEIRICLSWGITVLRYSNDNIRNNFNVVTKEILKNLGLTFADLKPI